VESRKVHTAMALDGSIGPELRDRVLEEERNDDSALLKALSNEMAANPIIFFESPPIFTAT
jgi:hypothetical protein